MSSYDFLLLGGRHEKPSSPATIEVRSPFDGSLVGRVPEARHTDVDRAVSLARQAIDEGPWPHTSGAERADALDRLLVSLQKRSGAMAETITREMGSPISFSHAGQVFASHMILDYYAKLARSFAFEERREAMIGSALVRHPPVGVAAAIVPWNVPLFTIMLKLAPALAAGCAVVVKPAPETPLDAYLLAEALDEAEIPKGIVSILPAGREVGEYLVTHPGVDKVAFTGSTAAGRRIAVLCGERLRRVTLELGGKSAAILCDDVDLATAIPSLVGAGVLNNGQACVAQTRILAPRSRYAECVDALAAAMRALPVGDPLDPATAIGPLVAERQRDRVEGYIAKGRAEGARVVTGGGRPAGLTTGWFVEPTLFADVDNTMTIARDEIFGPVLAVIPYQGDDEAVRLANDSEYGLSGSVWTSDPARGLALAKRMRSGTSNVNHFMMAMSSPFGGCKASGLGRELGPEGLRAYLEPQTICLAPGVETV
ncbi:aldehyde dehydrogenase [Myxococcota bacterium]|nr:aldehyde dehydrogenase [Myxococcota bacterium]MCZ7618972.1 aldehyde dehydrogenase [Myxococcota bacterium]